MTICSRGDVDIRGMDHATLSPRAFAIRLNITPLVQLPAIYNESGVLFLHPAGQYHVAARPINTTYLRVA
jgi:hypothetical protein